MVPVARQHSLNHSLAELQLSRRHSEHPSEGARQMRRIREASIMSGLSRRRSVDQVARRTLQPKPQDVWSEWDADGFGQRVHETRGREARQG